MKNSLIFYFLVTLQFSLANEISYLRYYANEKDFIANVPMKATNRRGYDHLTAYFNDRNLPIKLEYYISNGSLKKRETMEYNSDKVLIKKGESIPCEISESYSTVHEGQEAISCTITESKSPETDPRFVKIIHEESLDLPPGRPANQEIVVTYAYDENQMIHASFKDVESGNEKIISISMAGKNKTSPDIDKFLVD